MQSQSSARTALGRRRAVVDPVHALALRSRLRGIVRARARSSDHPAPRERHGRRPVQAPRGSSSAPPRCSPRTTSHRPSNGKGGGDDVGKPSRADRRQRRTERGARAVPGEHPGRPVQRRRAGSRRRPHRQEHRPVLRRRLRRVRHQRNRARGPQEDRASPRRRQQARPPGDARRDARARRIRPGNRAALRPSRRSEPSSPST